MPSSISPLAPKTVPDLPPIEGVRCATAAAGIRYPGRADVLLVAFDKGTTVAGVFTRSKCPSAPVEWCRAHLKGGTARALVVNSGNANAFTGKNGRQAAKLTAALAAKALPCRQQRSFPRLHRRDRRAARRDKIRRASWTHLLPAPLPADFTRPPRRS